MEEREELFSQKVPVFVGMDDPRAIGAAQAYRNLETGQIQIVIDFNDVAGEGLEGIFRIISTKALCFEGPIVVSEEEERELSKMRHPAGSKRHAIEQLRLLCLETGDDGKVCGKTRGHDGPHA